MKKLLHYGSVLIVIFSLVAMFLVSTGIVKVSYSYPLLTLFITIIISFVIILFTAEKDKITTEASRAPKLETVNNILLNTLLIVTIFFSLFKYSWDWGMGPDVAYRDLFIGMGVIFVLLFIKFNLAKIFRK